MGRLLLLLSLPVSIAVSQGISSIGSKPNPAAQAAADVLRDSAEADAAFIAAGLLKEQPAGTHLASLLQYPTDELVVVKLKGSEIKQTLERSVANYPQFNSAFLQLSGISVTFSESAEPGSRILEVRIGDGPLSVNREYTVAMPASLARGALGYFKIWDKTRITKRLGMTVEDALKGKTGEVKTPRYIVKP